MDLTRPTIERIQRAVAAAFGIPLVDLLSDRRDAATAHARQVAMLLARELTFHSTIVVGRHFRRDHTTVIAGVNAVRARIARDPRLAATCARLAAELGAREPAAPLPVPRRPAPNGDFLPGPLFDFAAAYLVPPPGARR